MQAHLPYIAQAFEAAMLLAFGAAWPVSILKTLQSKSTSGKSVWFLVLVLAGYLSGTTAKLLRAWHAGAMPEAVTTLYVINAVLVSIDISLYLHFRRRGEPVVPQVCNKRR